MSTGNAWKLVKQTVTAWSDDHASSMGAALSYYTLFSIAPLLLIVIAVAGFFFGDAAARGEIMGQLQGLLGTDGARAVEALLKSVNKPAQGIIATVAGVAALLIGATGVFGELQNDLDRIWRAPVTSQSSGIMSLLRTRLLSFGLVPGVFLEVALHHRQAPRDLGDRFGRDVIACLAQSFDQVDGCRVHATLRWGCRPRPKLRRRAGARPSVAHPARRKRRRCRTSAGAFSTLIFKWALMTPTIEWV
ncbi:MAG TPA: YhjD/YihY/BrkB family envelope integrity protein [Steroidobacteraceae bacterium]|nr:YhjD/YihY/BrkB family envelope integrity protein [Steroidobacteraceae bacterium]